MDVVGRDQAPRGQPVDKPVTRSVRHRDREHDQHREKDREMLARGKELDGDNDKLLVEHQQDPDTDDDMNMDSETDQPGSLIRNSRTVLLSRDEYRDECFDENRFERGFEFNCVFAGHSKGRFDYGVKCVFKCVFKCVYTRNEIAASEFWEIS